MKIKALSFCLMFGTLGLAQAGSGFINIQINPSCTIDNATINLGNYTPESGNIISAPIEHECSNGISYSIKVSNSDLMTGNTRHLKHNNSKISDTFKYNLYKNSSQDHWGETTNDALHLTGTGKKEKTPIFIETIPNQFITPGTYQDTLTMTLTY